MQCILLFQILNGTQIFELWASDALCHELQENYKCNGNQQCNRHLYFPGQHYSLRIFPDFPIPMIIFKTFQGLENFYIKLQDFPYFFRICTNPAYTYKFISEIYTSCTVTWRKYDSCLQSVTSKTQASIISLWVLCYVPWKSTQTVKLAYPT